MPSQCNSLDEIFDQCTIHLIPVCKSAQILSIGFAFDEPRVIVTCGALIIWEFFLDGADEGRDAPPFILWDGVN